MPDPVPSLNAPYCPLTSRIVLRGLVLFGWGREDPEYGMALERLEAGNLRSSWSTTRYALQYSTVQYSAHSTVQYSTVQTFYSTVQYVLFLC